jgi:phosphoribosylformylglycinamidine synthase
VSDGGLLCAVAESAMASGIGCDLSATGDAGFWFGEDQGRYVVATKNADAVLAKAKEAGIPAAVIGKTGGSEVKLAGVGAVSLSSLKSAHEAWLPTYMK